MFSNAISQYITFELRSVNMNKLKIVFSTSILVQMGLGVIVLFIVETLGFKYKKV